MGVLVGWGVLGVCGGGGGGGGGGWLGGGVGGGGGGGDGGVVFGVLVGCFFLAWVGLVWWV